MATINGSNGVDDILPGTVGNDTINGLSGFDIAQIDSTSSGAIFSRDGSGRWVVTSSQGADTLSSIEQVQFTTSNEFIALGYPETLVNTTTTDQQQFSSVTALADGGWLVSWESNLQDGSGLGVYQQRYNADGSTTGWSETLVNTTTIGGQHSASVTALPDGGWLVSWTSSHVSALDIFLQRYNADGSTAGWAETQVNTYTTGNQQTPSVAALVGGGWLVSWTSAGQDGDAFGVYQQRYNADGSTTGWIETRVNTVTTNSQQDSSVTALSDGGWLVSWMSVGQDGSGYGIYQQRYAANGSPVGLETLVNTITAADQRLPSVTALADGGWLVSWMAPDADGTGIYQQRYAANGSTVGVETLVNTTTTWSQYNPSVTALADGGWLVSWTAPDSNGNGIYQQRYATDGSAVGVETRVNTTTLSDQANPSVTALNDGGWLVSWMSNGTDGSGNGIYQQRYHANGSVWSVIAGDAADNTLVFSGPEAVQLNGAGGSDTLQGGSGDDTLDGGTGIDTAQFVAPSSGAVFSLDAQGHWEVTSSAGVDRLDSVEQIHLNGEVVTLGRNELRVNTTTANDQYAPSVATLKDGGWLVSWQSENQDGSGAGIYQQRYAANGAEVGSETWVNTTTGDNQYSPKVTALADGGWLVSWMSYNQDGDSWGIYQQRYNADGSTTGWVETRVNTTALGYQINPCVTGLKYGGWLVSWMSDDGSGYGIYQQRYAANGTTVGLETRVNSVTANEQSNPSVTDLADGGWLVCWTSFNQDGSGFGIYQQRYNADGSTTGWAETRVNTTTADTQLNPSVTALTDGGWLVSWMSYNQDGSGYGIYQQRYAANGTAQGMETLVNTATADEQQSPSVTALADGGWLVAWTSNLQDGSSNGVFQQRYAANGTPTGPETQVNTTTALDQFYPSAAGLADGGWLVSWFSNAQDGSGYGVYQQRYDASGAAVGTGLVLTGDGAANTLVFAGPEAVELDGAGGDDTLQGSAGDDTLDGGIGTDQATVIVAQGSLNWDVTADGRLMIHTGPEGSDELLAIERVMATDGAVTLSFNGNTETRVNTTTANDQYSPTVTALNDGGWLVSWQSSGQDGDGFGIYQQRYDLAGNPVGVETRVNTTTADNQYEPTVAALNDGGWLVGWYSYNQDEPGNFNAGIYQQRYDLAGNPVGVETRVNTTTINDQNAPTVTALNDGGWLVSWTSVGQDGGGSGIYQQRYDLDGNPVGVETRVNTTTINDQSAPTVTALNDGGWLVSWTSWGQDGGGWGIYQQRYDLDGNPVGVETRVNTNTATDQYSPTVTALNDGGWLVSWQSADQDGSGHGIYQQRYNQAGNPVGVETRVNTATASDQIGPTVTALNDGGWLVSWTSWGQDGSNNGIYQQRYDLDGKPVGVETRVNITTDSDQYLPTVTALSDGGWLVSWTSVNQDEPGNFNSGVYQQRYSADGLRDGHLTLTGDAGASTLRMASAAEGVELIGGSGGDTLAGGAFSDRLTGGADLDAFEFAASGNGRDHITDFADLDIIRVAGAAFASAVTDGDGSSVGQNVIQVSHTATQTVLHIGTDAVPGADVEILLDGVFPAGRFLATGTDITLSGAPTLTFMAAPVDTVNEDTQVQITFAEIAAQGDEADSDGTVTAFVIQEVSTGTLRIGTSAGAATPFVAGVNDTVDATHHAYWTPALDANGALAAFTLLAQDNEGNQSTGPVQVAVDVTAVNDAPVLTLSQRYEFIQPGLTIPGGGAATPYPSTLPLAGFTGSVLDVDVRLLGVSHGYPDDIDVLLVGPDGQSVMLMSDAGASIDLVGVDLTFDDEAATPLPDSTQIVSGSYQPTDFLGGDFFPAPAPAGPYGSALSVFDGLSPNGNWSLYAVDDSAGIAGTITSWGLDITFPTPVYTENAPPLANLAYVEVSDVDSANLSGATIQISAGFQTGDVLAFTNQLGITGSWDLPSRTLTLSGTTTLANYQSALAAVTFANTTDNPGSATRTLSWRVTDSSAAPSAVATSTVLVTPVNDTPVVSTPLLNQGAAVFETFNVQVPAGSFTDPDGDTLTYSATQVGGAALPAWLSFNPATRTFSGTPGPLDTGVVHVRVTAADPSLASTFDDFDLTVASAAARVYIQGTDIGGGLRTLTANTAFLGAVPSAYQWYRGGLAAGVGVSITVPASDNFALYTVQVTHPGGPTTSGAVDPQAATPPAGILQSTGNPGNDTLPAAPIRAQTFIGYHGLDTITGTNGADWIDGGPDVDSMVGGLGNDTYIAHDALDVIVEAAGGGTDLVMSYVTITLPAEVENLTLVGSNPFNGTGNSLANTITGNGAINTIAGLAGNDSVNAGAGDDVVDGGADNDTLNGGDGGDTLLGGTGNDSLLGAAGSDSLDGGDNDDKLDGGAAADVLLGGNGNDSLIGNGGNDTLTGGGGVDTLNGGAGTDTFVLDNTSIDVIQSFAVVDDTFRLSKSLFPALNLGTLNGAAFWSGTGAHDPDDRIVYNPGTGALWYDADGNGAGAAIQIATLTGLVGALTQADFVVVA